MAREIIQPEGVFVTRGTYPYEQVCRHGKHVYIAGQLALDADGKLVGRGDFAVQTRQVFRNIEKCLASVGATFDNVVKLSIFSTDMDNHVPIYAPIRSEFFSHRNVPSTYVQVARLVDPDCLIEIDAVAILD
jgi:enamine deaminase RidA (YjgF/YER057c/UK114 family)